MAVSSCSLRLLAVVFVQSMTLLWRLSSVAPVHSLSDYPNNEVTHSFTLTGSLMAKVAASFGELARTSLGRDVTVREVGRLEAPKYF